MNTHMPTLETVADRLRAARRVLIVTGAGISAESGLPTYRGFGGLYERETTEEGYAIEEVLSGEMFARRPELVWKYLLEIEQATRGAKPNRGHEVIAELEQCIDEFWVLSQNVDGLHRAAGSRKLIEIHGNLHRLRCTQCQAEREVADYSGLEAPPRCTSCGGVLRPAVVLFGEMLPTQAILRLQSELMRGFDMVFSIGTSSGFPYIAEPVLLARREGVPTVEINPGETLVSDWVDYRIAAPAAGVLDTLARLLDQA